MTSRADRPKRNARTDTPLTTGQERFAQEFVKSNNASDAYRIAYPQAKPSSHGSLASVMLKNPKVAARIADLQAEIARRNDLTTDRVIQELAAIGFADMGTYLTLLPNGEIALDWSTLPAGATRAIQEVTQDRIESDSGPAIIRTKFRLHPKTPALELLGKAIGMFAARVKIDVRDVSKLTDAELEAEARTLGVVT